MASGYISILSQLVFTSGSTNGSTKCMKIFTADDNVLGGNKTFTVELKTSDSSLNIGNNRTIVTITDNEGNKDKRKSPCNHVTFLYSCDGICSCHCQCA